MRNKVTFIVIGAVIGMGIAFFVSQTLDDTGYAVCIIFLVILLGIGGEFLPIIRKVPAIEQPQRHFHHPIDEDDP
jgi:hypothetical protein